MTTLYKLTDTVVSAVHAIIERAIREEDKNENAG